MKIESGTLSMRMLVEADLPLMARWLSDPEVLQYYEGRDHAFNEEQVRRHYFQRTNEVTGCIVSRDGLDLAYLQFYPVTAENKRAYGYDEEAVIYGMDQFIGETAYWNKGIGTEMVSAAAAYLTGTLGAERVMMDPQAWNKRALRCYEKCGFRKRTLLPRHEYHEGEMRDCWLIEYVPERDR